MSSTSDLDRAVGLGKSTIGLNDPLWEGSEEDRREARADSRRRQRRAVVEGSRWPRLNLDELELGPFGLVEHVDGARYKIVHADVLLDAEHSSVSAWFINDGEIVLLEPMPAPKA